jgi:hypothetical protein
LFAGVRRNLRQPARFVAVGELEVFLDGVESVPIPDIGLTKVKGCYARLRMFDPEWQRQHGFDGRIVCIDLDTVITGPLDPLFDRPEPFVIMQGGNASNPCPYNGALMMLRAGAHADVWRDFSVDAAARVPFHEYPDDQGWIANKVPGAAGWRCGEASGVYVFRKPGWPKGSDNMPLGARLVTFINRTPGQLIHLDWVKHHWR